MGKIKDLKGKKYDSGIEVLEFEGIKNHAAHWKCKCSCGNIFIARGADLNNGHTKSCGAPIHKYVDIKDQTFGELTAKEYIGGGRWKCQCSCGNTKNVFGMNLRSGGTSSCGCKTTENRINTLTGGFHTAVHTYTAYEDQEILPTFKVANATMHFDETSPHMHIVGVPIIENCARGMKK